MLEILRHSTAIDWLERHVYAPLCKEIDRLFLGGERLASRVSVPSVLQRGAQGVFTLAALIVVGYGLWQGVHVARSELSLAQALHVVYLGSLTLLRVAFMVVAATVIWTPVGVRIGFTPRLARIAQPLAQIGASFPANLLFPVVVILFLRLHVNFNWGSALLIALGTQWYILFNVIAGASAVPSDLREAALVFRLRGWTLWRTLILPAIFPAWVTGALTAAGGAWNASIVAEVASWGPHHLRAQGLGAYVAEATTKGDWPAILCGIATMSAYVVLLNRAVWRPLYALAEDRYRLG